MSVASGKGTNGNNVCTHILQIYVFKAHTTATAMTKTEIASSSSDHMNKSTAKLRAHAHEYASGVWSYMDTAYIYIYESNAFYEQVMKMVVKSHIYIRRRDIRSGRIMVFLFYKNVLCVVESFIYRPHEFRILIK